MKNKIQWFYQHRLLLNILYKKLKNWISKNKELILIVENNEFYNSFIYMIYIEYVQNIKPSNNNILSEFDLEYFELKYSSDIIDLYIEFKNICNNHCYNIFNGYCCNSYNLINFISKNINLINDNQYEEEPDKHYLEY
tara:strand:- start:1423 stop:1836 length:414 start_codon:yes stop_codon:yes gene_type:complete